jgi:hydrogenase nickel incorporation protein HypB
MCTVCGCGQPDEIDHGHTHDHGHSHDHDHDHAHHHHHAEPSRLVTIEQDILAHNNRFAAENRAFLGRKHILALNLVSSPGSGKTTLLCRTVHDLSGRMPIAVIEGDQQTSLDAERIRDAGAPAVQINTGKGCHLDAHGVGHAIETLNPPEQSLLFIENVGNLVCPAAFDLGEAAKVVILSVAEGDDKPLKYPDMFAAADLLVLNKIDLLPYLSFDVDRCISDARRVNPRIGVVRLSATTGEGLERWYGWIEGKRLATLNMEI